ncbi:hypothetical protein SKAU_G00160380 [Synaphobranchus kaupii]|uniref:Uncharacterized protein n=1 Tax=Synaphobranchus kaupii TaxID=118154 RepID=A0A9Q1FIE0_SYNKA|nr:hypothetical protein SKAU_G00160380 [Synaphobranchus kaupii]
MSRIHEDIVFRYFFVLASELAFVIWSYGAVNSFEAKEAERCNEAKRRPERPLQARRVPLHALALRGQRVWAPNGQPKRGPAPCWIGSAITRGMRRTGPPRPHLHRPPEQEMPAADWGIRGWGGGWDSSQKRAEERDLAARMQMRGGDRRVGE